MNVTRFTNGLPEKVILGGKQMILVLKMTCSRNFRSTLNIFLTFCSIKGAKKHKKIIFKNFSCKANIRLKNVAYS